MRRKMGFHWRTGGGVVDDDCALVALCCLEPLSCDRPRPHEFQYANVLRVAPARIIQLEHPIEKHHTTLLCAGIHAETFMRYKFIFTISAGAGGWHIVVPGAAYASCGCARSRFTA